MATWTPRTTSPTTSDTIYPWDWGTTGQCTWYAYFRVQEGYNMSDPPCWQSGYGSSGPPGYGSGKYNNAATWLDHYRDPWETKSISYTPVPGDIAVFKTGSGGTGPGHVAVIESIVNATTAMISDYNINLNQQFSYRQWTIGGGTGSTAVLKGYLHYPSDTPPEPPTPTPLDPLTISIVADITIKKGGNVNVSIFKPE